MKREVNMDTPFRFNEICRRRKGRHDLKLSEGWEQESAERMPFADPLLWSKFPITPFVHKVLGEGAVELWRGVVDNMPGSLDQGWHRDGEHLFDHTHL